MSFSFLDASRLVLLMICLLHLVSVSIRDVCSLIESFSISLTRPHPLISRYCLQVCASKYCEDRHGNLKKYVV